MTPRLFRGQATGPVLVALLMLALLLVVLPASASAVTKAKVRIDFPTSTLFGPADVSLPGGPVAPAGADPGQSCARDSALAAISSAVGGDWSGTWSDTNGFSLDRVKTLTAAGSRWVVFVNGAVSQAPCKQILEFDNDYVRAYPVCTTATTNCFTRGHLEMRAPANGGQNNPVQMQVFQTVVTFDDQGHTLTMNGPSTRTRVDGPDGWNLTDDYFGETSLQFVNKGDNPVYTSKNGFVYDSAIICVTNGADGYCGTSPAPQNPFDPNAFCQTNGFDGACGTTDQTPPTATVLDPVQKAYPQGGGPTVVTGTVSFDVSGVKQINIRIMRSATVTRTVTRKRKVTVKKRVKGKLVRKRVTKKVKVKVKKKVCYGYAFKTGTFTTLKACDASLAAAFPAEGGSDSWTVELPNALTSGSYTLDARAEDGVGNIEPVSEAGRNRLSFTVK